MCKGLICFCLTRDGRSCRGTWELRAAPQRPLQEPFRCKALVFASAARGPALWHDLHIHAVITSHHPDWDGLGWLVALLWPHAAPLPQPVGAVRGTLPCTNRLAQSSKAQRVSESVGQCNQNATDDTWWRAEGPELLQDKPPTVAYTLVPAASWVPQHRAQLLETKNKEKVEEHTLCEEQPGCMLQECGQMAVRANKHQSGTWIAGVRLPLHTTKPAEGLSVPEAAITARVSPRSWRTCPSATGREIACTKL